MDTINKKVVFKTDVSNVTFKFEVGYATQGNVIIRIPSLNLREDIDITNNNTKSYPMQNATEVFLLGKFFPAGGKSVILCTYTFTENGKEIYKEVIEKQTQSFERTSHIFTLEKEVPKV